jgi:hypothetical protein
LLKPSFVKNLLNRSFIGVLHKASKEVDKTSYEVYRASKEVRKGGGKGKREKGEGGRDAEESFFRRMVRAFLSYFL